MERNPYTGQMEEHPASVQAQIALGMEHNRALDRGVKPLPVVNQAPGMDEVQAILHKYDPSHF